MKKKLVVFHPAIAPYRIDLFNSLAEEFDASFYFLYMDVLEQSFDQKELGKELHFQPQYLSAGLLGLKNLRKEVFTILRQQKPDIVFCSEYNLLGGQVLLYRFLYRAKMKICTICDDSVGMALAASETKKRMRNYLVSRFDGIILANREALDWYKETYPRHRDKFLYFPIIQEDIRFRRKLENALPVSEQFAQQNHLKGRKILLFVGRLVALKNLMRVLATFRKVIDHHPEALLILVGEGEERERLVGETIRLGIQKQVVFTGKKQGNELYAMYNVGQISILASDYEAFGAVVNEALLAGCYALCSTAAGAACLIAENENGELFSPHQETELFHAFDKALRRNPPLEQIRVKPNRMTHSYREYFRTFIQQLNHITG